MKKLFLGGFLLAAGTNATYAQCDKKVVITSTKTEHLAADSSVAQSENDSTTVEFDRTTLDVTVRSPDHDQHLKGTVKSYSCDWSQPYKEGKTVIKATLTNDEGETRDLTITVTGTGGKVGFLAELSGDETQRIRLLVDKFEEKK
ncbi:MAG TPA: hypothetical protein VGR89_14600 [Puia sp.]|nr:hypothetical protein [Puia sp.]